MYICLNCEKEFEKPKIHTITTIDCYNTPLKIKSDCCKFCGSKNIVKATKYTYISESLRDTQR